MSPRLDYASVAPEGRQALFRLKTYIGSCGIDPKLRFLIEIRVSQINGCAFCVDTHCEEALDHFSEKELVDLNFVVINMNALNRLGVTFRKQPEAR